MTISELIQLLEEAKQHVGEDAEVRVAHQPSWPFEYSIDNLGTADGVVYLGEGQQLGYLPGAAAEAIGW